ncbi:hypothetical protein GGS21DRAFT_488127 [Xylaria nigripes]|nr:hypothetical protein GGS21DRAFT_488127 [Xylaria nigripes]
MAKETSIATRAIIVTLKSPTVGKTSVEIAKITGVSVSQINRIYSKAIERGFKPDQIPFTLRDAWLQDAPRSGRPTKEARKSKPLLVTKPTPQNPVNAAASPPAKIESPGGTSPVIG